MRWTLQQAHEVGGRKMAPGVNPGIAVPFLFEPAKRATDYGQRVVGQNKIICRPFGANNSFADVYPGLTTSNVTITYEQTGLGFAGNPGGPAPTVTVEETGLTFDFVFLNGLLGFARINMPTMRTTITGEDLSTTGS